MLRFFNLKTQVAGLESEINEELWIPNPKVSDDLFAIITSDWKCVLMQEINKIGLYKYNGNLYTREFIQLMIKSIKTSNDPIFVKMRQNLETMIWNDADFIVTPKNWTLKNLFKRLFRK